MAQNMAVYYQITNDRVQYVTISPSDHICQLVHAVWKMHYELSKTGMAVYQCNQHFKESKQALPFLSLKTHTHTHTHPTPNQNPVYAFVKTPVGE
eukprot:680157-Amphidinium_carterae.1